VAKGVNGDLFSADPAPVSIIIACIAWAMASQPGSVVAIVHGLYFFGHKNKSVPFSLPFLLRVS
jgi:hypothetical protein